MAFKGAAEDEVLRFIGLLIVLPLDDLAGEEDAFEVKDREVVIF